MKKFKIFFSTILFLSLLLTNASFALDLYDDFSGTYIDKTKWRQREWVRWIEPGSQRLLIKQASPSPIANSTYPYHDTNNLNFSDPNSVNSIQADVTILQNNITNNAFTRPWIVGRWYNDGTPGGGMTGDIQAGVGFWGDSSGLSARWVVLKFTNADGSVYSVLGSGKFTTPINSGAVYTLYISYDVPANRFIFEVGTEQKPFGPSGLPTRVGDANSPWKALGTRVEVDDSTSSGFVSVTFDNVYKNGILYDDFPSSIIDATKWTTYELVREISGGQLSSGLRSSSASTSSIYNRLDFVDPSSINVFQAKVTPLIYQNNQGAFIIAGIAGYYYNDGTTGGGHLGLVEAIVYVGGFYGEANPVAGWEVNTFTDYEGNSPLTIQSGVFSKPIFLGSTYTLFLEWNGSKFTFKIDDEEAAYTPTTTINPPNLLWKAADTRVWNPAGKEAIIGASFDDVQVSEATLPPSNQYTLTVSKSGAGNGTVTSSPAGINCGSECSEAYDQGTAVTLTAAPSSGSTFTGWSGGGCSGTGTCTLTMNADKAVTATFTPSTTGQYTLTVNKSGAGTGTVTSTPAGITCGSTCTKDVKAGTKITLKAKADTNSTFAGWSGSGYSGTGACVVVMNADAAVTAAFSAKPPAISISPSSVNFGNVNLGITSEKTVTIQNKGYSDLVINSINIAGANASDFSQTNNCTTIPIGNSCTMTAIFTPTSVGKKSGTISISSNDPKKRTLTVKVSGNGKSGGSRPTIEDVSQKTGPSGASVTIQGIGFAQTSQVTFGQIPANLVIFVSDKQLDVLVPFGKTGDIPSPLPPGDYPIRVDGSDPQPFTVTTLPENPNAPGIVLQNVVASLAQGFSANLPSMTAAIEEAKGLTTDANAKAYLQQIEGILPTFQQFLSSLDMLNLLNLLVQQYPTTLGLIERVLLSQFPPEMTLQGKAMGGTASCQADPHIVVITEGDQFLCKRIKTIHDANFFHDLGRLLSLLDMLFMPEMKLIKECAIGTLSAILSGTTGAVIDQAVASEGIITQFRIDDNSTPSMQQHTITLATGESKQMYAGIWVEGIIAPFKADRVGVGIASEALAECAKSAAFRQLPKDFRDWVQSGISLFDIVKSLGYGDGGSELKLGNRKGPMMISFGNVYFPPRKLWDIFVKGLCTDTTPDGQVKACSDLRGNHKIDETYEYYIISGFADQKQEASATHVQVTFEVQGSACTYSLSSPSRHFDSNGGSDSVTINTQSGCAWQAIDNNRTWITITSGAAFTGSGTVTYTVSPNTGSSSRTGSITISGDNSFTGTITVTQSGVSCPTPGKPSTPSASPSNGATGVTTSPLLSWAPTTNTDSYDVYFGTSSNPPYVGNTIITTYPLSGLSNNTTYYWKIVAKKNCGTSTPGAVWSFTTGSAPCPTPGTPSTPSASPSNGATGVSISPTLSWAATSNTDSYDVYFGTSSNPPYVANTTNTSYSRSGLSYNTTYYWKVVAKNNCGNFTSGSVWLFTTGSSTPPPPPHGDTYTGTFTYTDTYTDLINCCQWKNDSTETIIITVSGDGRLIDPYTGIMTIESSVSVSGEYLTCVPVWGCEPAPGEIVRGTGSCTGPVSGSSGKVEASVDCVLHTDKYGSVMYTETFTDGTFSGNTLTGTLKGGWGGIEFAETITLTK